MFPCNSNPFRPRLFQSQKLYNNLCKLYAIFLAWFKIHGFLEAKYIFSEKLILSSFKWDTALITSVNTVDKKNKRKRLPSFVIFFKVSYKEHEWAQRTSEMSSWTRVLIWFDCLYHLNAITLYWQEKPTSFLNENKWIDNPRITILECVGAYS